jgi:hypothetical protein
MDDGRSSVTAFAVDQLRKLEPGYRATLDLGGGGYWTIIADRERNPREIVPLSPDARDRLAEFTRDAVRKGAPPLLVRPMRQQSLFGQTDPAASDLFAPRAAGARIENPGGGSMEVAETILAQLGGGRFVAMTGAKLLMGGPDFLQFRIGAGARQGINSVRIELSPDDTYTMIFSKIRGVDVKEQHRLAGLYVDQLRPTFTEKTGFDTAL